LVINNHCTDETDTVARHFEGRLPLRLLSELRPGKHHAANRAISEAKGRWIVWTDDDVLVSPDWLREFAATAERFPDAAAIGGVIQPWFPEPPDELLVKIFPTLANGFCGVDHGPLERVLEAESLYGANMAFQLSKIGDLRFLEGLGPNQRSAKTGDDV